MSLIAILRRFPVLVAGLTVWCCVFAGRGRDDVPMSLYYALAKEPQFDCVGEILANKPFPGSCVLIGKQEVITAAHCVQEYSDHMDTIESNGMKVAVNVSDGSHPGNPKDYSFRFGNEIYFGRKIIVHPGYHDSISNAFDLAIVELDRPVTGVEPASISLAKDELTSRVVGVGFGPGGPANAPQIKLPIQKFAGENIVDSLMGPLVGNNKSVLMCDFDSPDDPSCNKMGSPNPLPLEYISSGGDSGGGLFKQVEGNWKLVGVLSGGGINLDQFRKTGYYGQIMKWTRVSIFFDWIAATRNALR